MKVAIIGGGAAGVCAGRHCLKENLSFDIFEQTGNVGGTWNYTDSIGVDENGIPVHSSMYKGLRTNLPKELMAFEDCPYPQQRQSYLPQQEVIDYINSYTKTFQLERYIKFYKRVINVEPHVDTWLVEFEDVRSKRKESAWYDAVIVCNGHFQDPFTPDIPGIDGFKGAMKHSHDYRTPDSYKDKKVLVLGAGPSGIDISQQIQTVAAKVYLSHKSQNLHLPESVKEKPLLIKLTENKAFFEDGSIEDIDDILFCTGYNYCFPFLSEKCNIKVDEQYVHPLYKQIICIEYPTLAFIGIPFNVCPFPMFDIQVRFFLATLNNHSKLPSKEEMLKDLDEDIASKAAAGIPKRKYHEIMDKQGLYFADLAETAGITKIPPVITTLFLRVRCRNLNDCFRIVDDDNWEQVK